jgi:hypothetical protein
MRTRRPTEIWNRAWVLALLAVVTLAPLAAWADLEPQPPPIVPEPSGWLVFGLGALGMGWVVRRRARR